MARIAKVSTAKKNGDFWIVDASLPDGTPVVLTVLNDADVVAQLNNRDVRPKPADQITLGPVVLPDPEPPKPPTPEALERSQFFTDYDKERTDQILATLTPALASRYKAEYGALR